MKRPVLSLSNRIMLILRDGRWRTTTAIRQALWDTGEVEPTFDQVFAALTRMCSDQDVSVKKRGNGFQWRIE